MEPGTTTFSLGDCQAFVEQLALENEQFYSSSDGRGALRAFELTFEHRWIYIFELIQNAVDAGARSIRIDLLENGNGLVFQHDGTASLEPKDVKGLSKVFQSTKGASTVGFMGVGFKSVFGRFARVEVSGNGWTFRYAINAVRGEVYDDVQTDLLGAVVPTWDPAIAQPDAGYTTRFGLSGVLPVGWDLASDLRQFFPHSDHTPLAILAWSGLQQLVAAEDTWTLRVEPDPDGNARITASKGDATLAWQVFPARYTPSREAMARFLEHRRIQPPPEKCAEVYEQASMTRTVLGVLPLDAEGRPNAPAFGKVYATLPTDVALPIRLHIHAHWLLNISRTGLREIEDNAWQADIVARISDVLARVASWIPMQCPSPEAAKAAFEALTLSAPHADERLSELLTNQRWLKRLESLLADLPFVPSWAGQDQELCFLKPAEAIAPPPALAEAFRREPALLPSLLLGGPVVMDEILGKGARTLLERLGLLKCLAPRVLARTWENGLETWWSALPKEESRKRDLLFRLWDALAILYTDAGWKEAHLTCVRTIAGTWVPVESATYVAEELPTEGEPGGQDVRRLLEATTPSLSNRLPDGWVGALQKAPMNPTVGILGPTALRWLQGNATKFNLKQELARALGSLCEVAYSNQTLLISAGMWAMHRKRSDLLTHVLVETPAGPRGAPVGKSLVASPYVPAGAARIHLFPSLPPISHEYLARHECGVEAPTWRWFFEEAGAHGKLTIKASESSARRGDIRTVENFLGRPLSSDTEANDSGFTLVDYKMVPAPPFRGATAEVRAAFSSWLSDNTQALRGTGRRKASYTYYTSYHIDGVLPSTWARQLTDLPWVPCTDGELRTPGAVLVHPEPTCPDAPLALLPPHLVGLLQREGIGFGTHALTANATERLARHSAVLSPEQIVALIRESRLGQQTPSGRSEFASAVSRLHLPCADGRRVPIHRVVKRTGRPSRSDLGGWTVPLAAIEPAVCDELRVPGFPHDFPDTTTGLQAVEYLAEVWRRSNTSPDGLASEVRNLLPLAYSYVIEDMDGNSLLRTRWKEALPLATVFADREWHPVRGSDGRPSSVYIDDKQYRRFLPTHVGVKLATAGHLGDDLAQQLKVAPHLGLAALSTIVGTAWSVTGDRHPGAWGPRFKRVCDLLSHARPNAGPDGGKESTDGFTPIELWIAETIELKVTIDGTSEMVPVNAVLAATKLTVAGDPVEFSGDATNELVRRLSLSQQATMAVALASMLGALDNEQAFSRAEKKFAREFAPEYELTPPPPPPPPPASSVDSPEGERDEVSCNSSESRHSDAPPENTQRTPEPHGNNVSTQTVGPPASPRDMQREAFRRGQPATSPSEPSHRTRDASGMVRSLEQKLAKARCGKLEPGDISDDNNTEDTHSEVEFASDEEYRNAAVKYERENGRVPTLGSPNQEGWDLESTDSDHRVRRIEVKGKGCQWIEDEVVTLSRAQVHEAFRCATETSAPSWWLYVVEKSSDGAYNVLPLKNPVAEAGKWLLEGGAWRSLAECNEESTHTEGCDA